MRRSDLNSNPTYVRFTVIMWKLTLIPVTYMKAYIHRNVNIDAFITDVPQFYRRTYVCACSSVRTSGPPCFLEICSQQMACIFQERNWIRDFKNLNEFFRMKFLETVEETWSHRVNRFRSKCRSNFPSIRKTCMAGSSRHELDGNGDRQN